MRNHYKTLGIERDADQRQIKQAYWALCKKHHPDLHPGPQGTRLLQEINDAYGVLSDPWAKATHDLELRAEELARGIIGPAGSASSPAAPSRPTTAPIRARRGILNLACECCGLQDPTLRWTSLHSVMTLVESNRTSTTRLLCATCRTRENVRCTVKTWLLGWWGISGPKWAFRALKANLLGVNSDRLMRRNAELLILLGEALYAQNRKAEAALVLSEPIVPRDDPKVRELQRLVGTAAPPAKEGRWPAFLAGRAEPPAYSVPLMVLLLPLVFAIPLLTIASFGLLPLAFAMASRRWARRTGSHQ